MAGLTVRYICMIISVHIGNRTYQYGIYRMALFGIYLYDLEKGLENAFLVL